MDSLNKIPGLGGSNSKAQTSDPLNPGDQPRDGSQDTGGSIADEFSRSVNAALSGIGNTISEMTGTGQDKQGSEAGQAAGQALADGRSAKNDAKDEQIQDFLRDKYKSTSGDVGRGGEKK
jgi:hypothetical protein